ncbi:hypothetical protein [Methanobacterium sp.]|uniref:hypothetical protein n=1 Tax=Methanobacterium sp. TaxID=2164 RepID=UPI00260032AE|nr:hypothetical protein [Methanobacterium sp.]MBI5459346.1 hypothetical protein [Methanobacterium sp.]
MVFVTFVSRDKKIFKGGLKISEDSKDGDGKKGWWSRQTLTAKILIGILILIVIIIIVAAASAMWFVMSITALNVTEMEPVSIYMDTFNINGTTEPGASVTINNQSVTPDSSGKFSYNLTNIEFGAENVTVVAKGTGKLTRTLIFELNRSVTSDGLYQTKTRFINETLY